MPTVEQSADWILRLVVGWGTDNSGRTHMTGHEIREQTGLLPEEINEAVRLLSNRGELVIQGGQTQNYSFESLSPSIEVRVNSNPQISNVADRLLSLLEATPSRQFTGQDLAVEVQLQPYLINYAVEWLHHSRRLSWSQRDNTNPFIFDSVQLNRSSQEDASQQAESSRSDRIGNRSIGTQEPAAFANSVPLIVRSALARESARVSLQEAIDALSNEEFTGLERALIGEVIVPQLKEAIDILQLDEESVTDALKQLHSTQTLLERLQGVFGGFGMSVLQNAIAAALFELIKGLAT